MSGFSDAFVTKLDPTGRTLLYSTFIGGEGHDVAHRIAVDASGSAYVAGDTQSSGFPVVNAMQPAHAGPQQADAFVVKVAPDGSALEFSTYLGGTASDSVAAIAIDGSRRVYVAGVTRSSNFPVRNAWQPTFGGVSDGFVTSLTSAGALSFSTYLGMTGEDYATALAVTTSGSVHVAGHTTSLDFPTTLSSYRRTHAGAFDVFVLSLASSGRTIGYSTLLGGSADDYAAGLALDPSGNLILAGSTTSANFPSGTRFNPRSRVHSTHSSSNSTAPGRTSSIRRILADLRTPRERRWTAATSQRASR